MQVPRTVDDLADLLEPLLRIPGAPPRSRTEAEKAAREYVQELSEQIRRDLIQPMNELLARQVEIKDVIGLGAWFGGVSRMCSVLMLNQRVMFWKYVSPTGRTTQVDGPSTMTPIEPPSRCARDQNGTRFKWIVSAGQRCETMAPAANPKPDGPAVAGGSSSGSIAMLGPSPS